MVSNIQPSEIKHEHTILQDF